jgi:hypothetical protein
MCSRTVHVLLRQGEGQKGGKRLGQQSSHITSGLARYSVARFYMLSAADRGYFTLDTCEKNEPVDFEAEFGGEAEEWGEEVVVLCAAGAG